VHDVVACGVRAPLKAQLYLSAPLVGAGRDEGTGNQGEERLEGGDGAVAEGAEKAGVVFARKLVESEERGRL
jgi:hypothetical protein